MKSRNRNTASLVLTAVAPAFALAITAAAAYVFLNAPTAKDPVTVRIAPGMTAREIGASLVRGKVIRSAL